MEQQPLLCLGDHVILTVAFDGLPSGVSGVVQWVYFPVAVYRVLFDGEQVPRLVHGSDLVGEPPARAREVSA
jgi:hypothetical protein